MLSGFPPKPLQTNGADLATTTLQDLGIKNGDQLLIKEEGKQQGIIKGSTENGKYIPPTSKTGYFIRRKVPSDNSCLFHSLSYVLKEKSRSEGPKLRELCANIVLENPRTYNNAVLGMSVPSYVNWLSDKDTWGGAIEISIMSEYFKMMIVAFDIQTCREDRYGEDKNYANMALIVYTGNHYDALALSPSPGASEAQDQVVFNSRDKNVLEKARIYVKDEHEKWKRESQYQKK